MLGSEETKNGTQQWTRKKKLLFFVPFREKKWHMGKRPETVEKSSFSTALGERVTLVLLGDSRYYSISRFYSSPVGFKSLPANGFSGLSSSELLVFVPRTYQQNLTVRMSSE